MTTALQAAMITGPGRDYFWILSREPELDEAIYQRLIDQARGYGFAVDEFIVALSSPASIASEHRQRASPASQTRILFR